MFLKVWGFCGCFGGLRVWGVEGFEGFWGVWWFFWFFDLGEWDYLIEFDGKMSVCKFSIVKLN